MVNALKEAFRVLWGLQRSLPEEAVFQLRAEESEPSGKRKGKALVGRELTVGRPGSSELGPFQEQCEGQWGGSHTYRRQGLDLGLPKEVGGHAKVLSTGVTESDVWFLKYLAAACAFVGFSTWETNVETLAVLSYWVGESGSG